MESAAPWGTPEVGVTKIGRRREDFRHIKLCLSNNNQAKKVEDHRCL